MATLHPPTALESAIARAVSVAVITALALIVAAAASAARADNTILNQTQVSDAIGDSGGGADLSGLTVTTYTDGTAQFAVQFANRAYMQSGDTVQIFIDLNDDGNPDLNLSVWPSFAPSYLDRWTGSTWIDIRQLPELVQSSGSISVRLALTDLQGAAAVPVAPVIQVAVGSWQADSSGNLAASASDWIPSATSWVDHSVKTAPATTTTTRPPNTTTAGGPKATPPSRSSPASKATNPPVMIEPLPSLSVKRGKDLILHILLRSAAGPLRTFKVCAQLPAGTGVAYPSQCRSAQSTGAKGAVAFTITYRIDRVGTDRVAINAAAGNAHATATEIVHVTTGGRN